jgi:probable FeS assembly SUF system protein SufT
MANETAIVLKRDCSAVMIPSGESVALATGSSVWLTQALGGSYTVMTDHGHMVRIDGRDGDALGLDCITEQKAGTVDGGASSEVIEGEVWHQLKACFDPEIPVNIVDLGLIYQCGISPLPNGGYKATIRFTLTAQGCGMGEFLKQDIQTKLLSVPGIVEADVELVWNPPWNQSMISGPAKQQLGIE